MSASRSPSRRPASDSSGNGTAEPSPAAEAELFAHDVAVEAHSRLPVDTMPAREPATLEPSPEPREPAPPGTSSFGGIVRVTSLDGERLDEWEGDEALDRLAEALSRPGARVWIDLCGAPPALIARVSRILQLHPLLAEDIAERDQRAKLEQIEELLHIVLFSLGWDDGQIYERELDFVLGDRFLLSSHSRWWDPHSTRLLRLGVRGLLRRGVDYLLWALADDVIDSYFPILDRLGDEIDDLEDQVVSRADRVTLERLFALKRELIQVRRVTAPEREMFNRLSSHETELVSRAHSLYYRDAYDHLIRLTDELDTYRELVSATVDAYLSTVNNNLSFIMKRLTGVTVILAGIGAIGGLFGMSEAPNAIAGSEAYGFWVVFGFCALLAAGAVALLHKIDWI